MDPWQVRLAADKYSARVENEIPKVNNADLLHPEKYDNLDRKFHPRGDETSFPFGGWDANKPDDKTPAVKEAAVDEEAQHD